MQYWLANWFDYRVHLIVPNVHDGFDMNHECDLLVVTKSGYLSEVEIKISVGDLRADKKKRHNHEDWRNRIKRFYFALPDAMEPNIGEIQPDSGVICVSEEGRCRLIRKAAVRKSRPLSEHEMYQLARLAAIKLWPRILSGQQLMADIRHMEAELQELRTPILEVSQNGR